MTENVNSVMVGHLAEPAFAACHTTLQLHQLQRAAEIPTVSVLVGATSLGISVWRHWSIDCSRRALVTTETDLGRIVRKWIERVLEIDGLEDVALAWLAKSCGQRPSELKQSLSGKSEYERDLVLRPLVDRSADPDVAKLCKWLIERTQDAPPSDARTVLFSDREDAGVSELRIVNRMMGRDTAPTLLVVAPEDRAGPSAWFDAAAEMLVTIAQAVPGLPVALAIPAHDFDRHIESAKESRAIAMLRETVLRLDGLEAAAIRRHIEESLGDVASCVDDSIRRLVRDGCSEELTYAFTEAACALLAGKDMPERLPDGHLAERAGTMAGEAVRDGERLNKRNPDVPATRSDDEARSAAERFLFERLQSLPETSGLFELNGKLVADFGPTGKAEVDLLARRAELAIEIDGYYHFQDLDCYRRDRRKDVALQKLGYLVLRVLAEDVVMRLDATLDAIFDAVSFRQGD